jgi:hypothetical protein
MAAARSWPPLIVGVQRPRWVRLRDLLLTCIAWLALAILLNRELDLGLTVYLDAMGMESYTDDLRSAGFVSRDQGPLGWSYFSFALRPYVLVFLTLFAFLLTFTVHTIIRRTWALRAPSPPPLSFTLEARQAGLAAGIGDALGTREDRGAARLEAKSDQIVDGRTLLAMLNNQDELALGDIRKLRVTTVEVRPAGGYLIHAGAIDGPFADAPKRLQA